jgi:hypothetical protein
LHPRLSARFPESVSTLSSVLAIICGPSSPFSFFILYKTITRPLLQLHSSLCLALPQQCEAVSFCALCVRPGTSRGTSRGVVLYAPVQAYTYAQDAHGRARAQTNTHTHTHTHCTPFFYYISHTCHVLGVKGSDSYSKDLILIATHPLTLTNHTHTRARARSLPLTHSFPLSLSLTHSLTHSLTLSLSHTHTQCRTWLRGTSFACILLLI